MSKLISNQTSQDGEANNVHISLLSSLPANASPSIKDVTETIDISEIKGISKYNVRKEYPDTNLDEMIASMKANGINLVPIIIDENNEVICGQRRFLSMKKAGLTKAFIIKRHFTPENAIITSLSENDLQFEITDKDRYDAVIALRKLGMTVPEIAKAFGKCDRTISRWASYNLLPQPLSATEEEAYMKAQKQNTISRNMKNSVSLSHYNTTGRSDTMSPLFKKTPSELPEKQSKLSEYPKPES